MTRFIDASVDTISDTIHCNVLVVGAGAAGLTLVRELSKSVKDVVLIESGGLEIDGKTQNLFSGQNVGLPYFNLTTCRLRYFGGTTNHWGGYCRANDPIDYQGRPELNLPNWPVQFDEIKPYISKAAEYLGLSQKFFNPNVLLESLGVGDPNLVENSTDLLQTKVFQIAENIRLGTRFLEAPPDTDNLTVYLNLNILNLNLEETGNSVKSLNCATLNGRKVTAIANIVVIACHAIENARILLASNDVAPNGIGNDFDHVGRYFMDHTHIHASKFYPASSFPAIYDRDYSSNNNLNANIGFSDETLRKNSLLQYYCRFNPVYISKETESSLVSIKDGFFSPGSFDYIADVMQALSEFTGVGKMQLRARGIAHLLPDYFELEHRLEQAPNPNSRVILSERKDALGNRIADLDWQLNDIDIDSFKRGQLLLAQQVSALGWGRFELEEITGELVRDRVAGHWHQIGTTRMSDLASDGVVDRNCKVHGIDNLYIAGSSVFPTAGYSGPTMMIIGFSYRLAEHITHRDIHAL